MNDIHNEITPEVSIYGTVGYLDIYWSTKSTWAEINHL